MKRPSCKKKLKNLSRILIFGLLFYPLISFSDNYYWIGDGGNWSDINHWAVSSGGSILHSQVPTAEDDVFFDANSFLHENQTIVVNLKNAVCKDLIWSNVAYTPRIFGTDTTNLRIYGSMELSPNIIQDYEGDIIFESVELNRTIKTENLNIKGNIRFLGIGGGWKLLDDLKSDKSIYFEHGVLETNDKSVRCLDFISLSPNYRTLDLSTSKIIVETWQINGQNLLFNALLADISITNFMSNKDGTLLQYPTIYITGIEGKISNSNVNVIFNDVNFAFNGTINGNCKINNLTVKGSGLITDNDTINKVIFEQGGTVNGGHTIGRFIGENISQVIGSNKIGVAVFYGSSVVDGANSIDSAVFYDNGSINQSNIINKLLITKYGIIDGSNNIVKAQMKGNGYFLGNNTFDTLSFFPGNTYKFNFETTQTINKQFNITGNCSRPIRILCDTNASQANIKCNQNVFGDYLSIRDIKAEGVTPFYAANSVDLGNNENWQIETANPTNLYWVNGTGSWSDSEHWDILSGGSGGHCPPTEIDNAFFDNHSFTGGSQSVFIDIKNAVCHDMIWQNTNVGQLKGPQENNIRIYGSLILNPQMNWLFLGQTFFEATDIGNIITMSGNKFSNHEWFVGKNGSWNFTDEHETQKSLMFQEGEIFTQGNDITCEVFSSTDTTTRKLHLSTSKVTMSKSSLAWIMNGQNLSLYADSSLLISLNTSGKIMSYNGNRLIYNNVIFYGDESQLLNNSYCVYNLVDFYKNSSFIKGDCTIDTTTFYDEDGTIWDSDTIKTVIFHKKNGFLSGLQHNIEIAYFYDDGRITGDNNVDTALFYKNAIIEETNNIDTCIVYNKSVIAGNNIIRTATLLGDGSFIGENQFTDLTLTKSNSYVLENNKTQTIDDNLNINGSCTGPIIIQSDKTQTQAVIHKTNGNVEADYVSLRDIKAEGNNLPFIANNSVDLGNNSNWNINTSLSKDLYWVGDSGFWSDSLHWSNSPGGIGGYCIPTPIDNVHFDQNSFSTLNDSVQIDLGNATCHNMTWNGAKFSPTFYSPDTNNLRIFGSIELNSDLTLALEGEVFFESTHDGNTLKTFNKKFSNNVFFQGINGHWSLSDNFETDSTIYFSNGELITNSNSISCWSFNSNFTFTRQLNIVGSKINLYGQAVESWYINGINLQLSADNSIITSMLPNSIFRNDFGGPFKYNKYVANGANSRVYNKSILIKFNKVLLKGGGQINGNCTIDSAIILDRGSIFDSDSINYLYIEDISNIDGSHKIHSAQLSASAIINGYNRIDSLIINGNCSISESNYINNFMEVYGKTEIFGSNFFNNLKLDGDGVFNGINEFNVLTFSPGNKYELEEGISQYVNKEFNIRGNNCFPITLRSKNDGIQASINIPQGKIVSGDFIEIRDIEATGGAEFYAGRFSTDISNNSGWLFYNSPGYIFGFPPDTTLCDGSSLIIGTDNFNPDENTTFLWQDGSINSEFSVNNEDSLWVKVTYANNCSYTDTIQINRRPSPVLDLGADQTICQGDSISIVFYNDSLQYIWSDGTTDSIYKVKDSETVWLKATATNGCYAIDSIAITAKPSPIVNLGNDTTLRHDESILLDAGNSGATYIWSTGDSVQTINVSGKEELVWVNVISNGCIGNDTILLSEYPPCILAVPNAFSPNGDGQNDYLYVRGNGFMEFEFLLFNRIGELVFKTNDESIGWDGYFKNRPQEVDVYMYVLKGKCFDGGSIIKKGNISLLR